MKNKNDLINDFFKKLKYKYNLIKKLIIIKQHKI